MHPSPSIQWYPLPNGTGSLQPHMSDPVQELYQLFNQYLRDLGWRYPTSDGLSLLQPHTANFIQELHRLFDQYQGSVTPDRPLRSPGLPPTYYATAAYIPANIPPAQGSWNALPVVSVVIMYPVYSYL